MMRRIVILKNTDFIKLNESLKRLYYTSSYQYNFLSVLKSSTVLTVIDVSYSNTKCAIAYYSVADTRDTICFFDLYTLVYNSIIKK